MSALISDYEFNNSPQDVGLLRNDSKWPEALPALRTERQSYLQRFVIAPLGNHAGRTDVAVPLLTELDAAAQTGPLIRWEPALAFEVKHQLIRALTLW